MGNSSSSHQPLERGFTRGTFGDFKSVVGIHLHLDMNSFLFHSLLVFFESTAAESRTSCGYPLDI